MDSSHRKPRFWGRRSHHADVWDLRRHWPAEKARLRSDLSTGDFRFGLLDRITKADGEEVDLWSPRDALVLKALAMVLAKHLPVSRSCTHVKGHGGAKAARDPLLTFASG